MERPTRIPDSMDVFELIHEFDMLAEAARQESESATQRSEAHARQGNRDAALIATAESTMYLGVAATYAAAASRLAKLFGIDRPEWHAAYGKPPIA